MNCDGLRNQVLSLAFSGKLTQHTKSDDDKSSLLKLISPNKNIEQIEHVPYHIPKHWAWVRLADLFEINPKVNADPNDDAAFIPMDKISDGFSKTFTYKIQKWETAATNHTRFADGDVCFAKISPCFENRKSFIAQGLPNGIGGGTTELIILRQPLICKEYTYWLIVDQRFIKAGSNSYRGIVGQQRVKTEVIKNYLVPLPPLSEQKRIVAKIEELMTEIDNIERLQSAYTANRGALKKKIIEAGITGKLVPQIASEGTAEELLKQIEAERAALIKAGKIKKEKPLPQITEDEIPFEIPKSWIWTRIEEITIPIGNNTDHILTSSIEKIGKIPVISQGKNIIDGYTNSTESIISDKPVILFGDHTKIVKYIDFDFVIGADGTKIFKPMVILPKYLFYLLQHTAEIIEDRGYARHYSLLRKVPLPLPPLSEQRRIVAKIEELMQIIDNKGIN